MNIDKNEADNYKSSKSFVNTKAPWVIIIIALL